MNKTKIQWTEMTWNPITGCTKISDGCLNCYAARMAKRLKAMGNPRYLNEFEVTVHKDLLEVPLDIKQPKMIFVNSMSDLFHKDVPDAIIVKVFETMNKAHWHTFQVLTKRAERIKELNDSITWTKNIWLGTTVESQKVIHRIDYLRESGAYIKFLSIEPLLTPINDLKLKNIDWVIVGGESGAKARPMLKEWVIDIKNQCKAQDVPFFFKQWGGKNKKKAGRLLDNNTYDEMPRKITEGIFG